MRRDIASTSGVSILVPSPSDIGVLLVDGKTEILDTLRESNGTDHTRDTGADDNGANGPLLIDGVFLDLKSLSDRG